MMRLNLIDSYMILQKFNMTTFTIVTSYKISLYAFLSDDSVYLSIRQGKIIIQPPSTLLPIALDIPHITSKQIAEFSKDHGIPHVQLKMKLVQDNSTNTDEWEIMHDFLRHGKISRLPLTNVTDPLKGTLTVEYAKGWIEPQLFNNDTHLFPLESDKYDITASNITQDYTTPLQSALDISTIAMKHEWDAKTSDPVSLIDHGIAETVENINTDTTLHPRTRIVYIKDPLCTPCYSNCHTHTCGIVQPTVSYTKSPNINITLPSRKQYNTSDHVDAFDSNKVIGNTNSDYSVLFRNLSSGPVNVFASNGTTKLSVLPAASKLDNSNALYTEVKISNVNEDKYSIIRTNAGMHTI